MKQELERVLSDPPLRIDYWRGYSQKLVVVFCGVGNNPREYPPIEFFNSATENRKNHALFISDVNRSWLNEEGIDATIVNCIEQVAKDSGTSELHLMGNSMGGSMALLLKDQVPANTILSFVPQYSVSPELVPEEKRWMRFRKKIKNFRYPNATLSPNPNQMIFIVHGGTYDELVHAMRFPRVRGVRHFIFPHLNHNVTIKLKGDGFLHPLVGAAINSKPYRFRRIIERNGGMFIQNYEGLDFVSHHGAQP